MNSAFRRRSFPLALQVTMLAAFALLIVGGLVANTSDMAFAKVLRNTNLANLIVWSYWWPSIIIAAVVTGRTWCMVCPMELVTSAAARVGLKLKPPRWLRTGWVITLSYVLILFVGVHTLAIHRVPFRMSLYMLALLGAAVLVGLLFQRTAFCAHVCPIGHLLGLYARLAPLVWGVRDKELCAQCEDQSCVAEATAHVFQGRSCGVGLRPANIDDADGCLLCGQCTKACDQNNPGIEGRPNPGLFVRPWFRDVLALKPMTAAQAAFCLVVSGFVMYEVVTEWDVTKAMLMWAPTQLGTLLGAEGDWATAMVKSLTLFVALPAVLWLLPYVAFRATGGKLPLGKYLCGFGIALIPIMGAAHVAKSLLKMTSRIPYWRYALGDPVGATTARGLLDKTIELAPPPAWRDPVMTVASLTLIALGIVVGVVVTRRLIAAETAEAGGRGSALYLLPVLYGGVFGVMLCAWRLF